MSDLRDLVDGLNATICQKTGYTYDPDTDTFTNAERQCAMAGWAVRRDWRDQQQWMEGRGMGPAAELTAMIRRGEGMDDDARAQVADLTEGMGGMEWQDRVNILQKELNEARQKGQEAVNRMLEAERGAEELRRVKDENLYLRGQVDALKWYMKETM